MNRKKEVKAEKVKIKTRLLIAGLVLAVLMVMASSASATAEIWTDKSDYQPEEIVYISGEGFQSNAPVYISITRPDSTIETGETATDPDGDFFDYAYNLDGIEGGYTVTASDDFGNTAETTFTDSVKKLELKYPTGGECLSGTIQIEFKATKGTGLATVYAYYGSDPAGPWTLIDSKSILNTNTYQIPWDTTTVTDGKYYIQIDDQESGSDYTYNKSKAFRVCNTGICECSVLLSDGFEVWPSSNWATPTNWYQASDQKKTGSYSAKSDKDHEGVFESIALDIDTTYASKITVEFCYRLQNTAKEDLNLYYCTGGTCYFIKDLGKDPKKKWNVYSDTITIDDPYFGDDFQIRFVSDLEGCEPEIVWIDDVVIRTCKCEPPSIPEFSTVALPALSLVGLYAFFSYRRKKQK